jgi:prevent-host-death family protein
MYMMMYIYEMSRRYSMADARTNLPTIVDQAEAGQKVELTRRGKPVAVVLSLRELQRLRGDRPRFREVYEEFLKKYSLEDVGLNDEFAEFAASIREKGTGRKVSL